MNRICLLLFLYFSWAYCMAAIYTVDSLKSRASFEVGYIGHGKVKGVLSRLSGSVELDMASKLGMGNIVFDMTGVETGNNMTNRFVKSSSVFDTEKFPTMQFNATRFDFEADRLIAVNGDLLLHGVTKAIRLEVRQYTCNDMADSSNQQCQGEFTTTVYRSHFGMNRLRFFVNDDVLINVSLLLDRVSP
jgi:polyisoprenoid-binding protein YceI